MHISEGVLSAPVLVTGAALALHVILFQFGGITVLAMDPEVLLLDEPTNGLDEETEDRITDILMKLNLSCVFVSHNLDFLSKTTDKIYAMTNGRISLDETLVPHPHIHAHQFGRLPHEHKS